MANVSNLLQFIMSRWIGSKKYEVVYDSEQHEFTSRSFWSHLKGRQNIIIFIITEHNYIFGTFHSKLPPSQEVWVEDDDSHFLFTLKNPFNTSPRRFALQKGWKKTLYIYGDDQNNDIFSVFNGFWISNNNECFIRTLFNNGYTHPSLIDNTIFVGSEWPTTFSLSRLLCVQFFQEEDGI
ncbi:hypothetical protein ENUP19_0002G0033 [Entamoeba nuttalli]